MGLSVTWVDTAIRMGWNVRYLSEKPIIMTGNPFQMPNVLVVRAVAQYTTSPISSVDNRIVDHTITTEFSSPPGIENVEPNTMPSSTSSGTS
jgi:hypothetical protein